MTLRRRVALHRFTGPEVYHFYAGATVRMLLLDTDEMFTLGDRGGLAAALPAAADRIVQLAR